MKRLTEMMGGTVGVESESGRGSCFWFTVRFADCTEGVTDSTLAGQSLSGRRILIVEGDSGLRATLQRLADGWGMTTALAIDGSDALEILRRDRYGNQPHDFVLLDARLPSMSGIDLARIIHSDPAIRGVRLVLLCEPDEKHEAAELRSAGIESSLLTPASPSKLLYCLNRSLHAGGHPGESSDIEPSGREAQRLNGVHVLLAEDNPVNQEVAVEMLQEMGCAVDTVANGVEVLSALDRRTYDAILMDCHMPLMDGFRATEEIRRREVEGGSRAHVPIIALTANVMKGDSDRCLRAGMDGFLGKPFKMDQLGEILVRHLAGRGQAMTPVERAAPTEAVPGADVPSGWDESRFQRLRALQRPGRPDALNKIIGIYLDCTPDLLQSLSDAIEGNDPEAIEMAAHSLKSCSGNLGALRLQSLFAELEAMGREKDTARAGEVSRQAGQEYEVVRRELEEKRNKKAA